MKQLRHTLNTHPVQAGLLPLLLAVFLFLFFRNAGLYPLVFIDEWIYSSGARMLPGTEPQVPSYLYFLLYRLTNQCGDSFLSCSQLLNALLFVGAGPFLYTLARRVAPVWAALLATAAALLAPVNVSTPFFMPEAAYFLSFWVICWAAFRLYEQPGTGRAVLLGAIAGAAAMVKLHALFLVPSAALFAVYAAAAQRGDGAPARAWLRQGALLALALVAGFAAVRFPLGYALGGKPGLHLLGPLYAASVTYTAKAHLPYGELARLALNNMRGHGMILVLLFSVPLAAMAARLVQLRDGARRDPAQALAVLTLLMLGAVVAVTVVFTASITGLGEHETAQRIHTRYYNFALPLLLLCALAALNGPGPQPALRSRAVIGVLLAGALLYTRWAIRALFVPGIIDSPELLMVTRHMSHFNTITVLGLAGLLAWVARPVLGARLFLLLFLPVYTFIAASMTTTLVRQTRYADAYSKAGLFARHYMDRAQTNKLTILADDPGGLHRTRFFIENGLTSFLLTPAGAPVDWGTLQAGSWVLMIGDYALPPDARIHARKDGMTLLQVGTQTRPLNRLAFTQPLPAGAAEVHGLSKQEPFGRWTDGPRLTIRFPQPLPQRMVLGFMAYAFGPNIGQEILVKVGGAVQALRLDGGMAYHKVRIDNPGRADTVEVIIPHPTAPRSLRVNDDERQLGMALQYLQIDEVTDD